MSCREFERGLDEIFAAGAGPAGSTGAADPKLWKSLERHAAGCDACSELLELARLPQAEKVDVAGVVLAKTSGAACRQVESNLNELVSDPSRVERGSRRLMAAHLEHCRACAGLFEELERLSADLPRLAVIAPERSLVAEVMRRTLPMPVRLRRWWTATWPELVRRPRFAVEFAFAATLVLIVIFATPGSPLQAMPERAFGLVRAEPLERFEVLPAAARVELDARLRATGAGGKRLASDVLASARAGLGTISAEVASWFVTDQEQPPAEDPETKEKP